MHETGTTASPGSAIVTVGRLGAPYGVHGFIRVHAYTKPVANILEYKKWHLVEQGRVVRQVQLLEGRVQSRGSVVALFEGYPSPETVRALTNLEVGVYRDELPVLEEDTYYWADLIGLQVINESEDFFKTKIAPGCIKEIFETPAHDIVVVVPQERTGDNEAPKVLLPFLMGHFIKSVDLKKRVVRIDWPEWF